MKTIIALTLLFFIHQPDYAQSYKAGPVDYYARVVLKTGLALKSEPSEKSKTLATVPFWGKISTTYEIIKEDTVQNTLGCWKKVMYNNVEGFMFDGFLLKVDSLCEIQKDIRIMIEGSLCGPPNFDPALNWYGIYRTAGVDSLIKVEITITRRDLSNNDEIEGGDMLISTNRTGKMRSILLIGSKNQLSANIVSYNSEKANNYYSELDRHLLYPGQTYAVYMWLDQHSTNNSIDLNAIGTVKDVQDCPVLENYRLRLTNIRNDFNNYITQDITADFCYKGECGMPGITWFGDIDNDKKPDLLFSAASTTTNQITLFLSSRAKNDEFVRKADQWTTYNCY